MIRAVEGRAARHAAHRKHLQQHLLAAQFRPRLVPINLGFLSELIALRHTGRTQRPSQLRFSLAHVLPHRNFGDFVLWPLSQDPLPDTMRRVTLLTWRSAIGFEDGLDEWNQRFYHRSPSLTRLALGRFSAGQRLPYHPPMHSKLGRDSLDASDSQFVFPADPLEQL